jgi:large subunit ribosomal protein L32
MAAPKRRHSKTRRNKRRSHDALSRVGTSVCDNCGEVKLPHRVCASCGHYRDREVIEVKESF